MSSSSQVPDVPAAGCRLRWAAEPVRLALHRPDGTPVLAGIDPARFRIRRAGTGWRQLGPPATVTSTADGVTLGWPGDVTFRCFQQAGSVAVQGNAPGAEAVEVTLPVAGGERFFGLGERFDAVDQTGRTVDLWVTNGGTGNASYKPIPWLLSHRGWGMSVDETCRIVIGVAVPTDPESVTVAVASPSVRLTFDAGASMADVLGAYTRRVGRPPVPPDWMFSLWLSGDWRTEDERSIRETVRRARAERLPIGVKLIDAMWEADEHSLTFSTERYDDPPALIESLRDNGIETVLWLSPSHTEGGEAYRAAADAGLLLHDADGDTYRHPLGNQPGWYGTTIDFTNPAAVAAWQDGLRRLLDLGVAGFKTDFGEQVPADAVFADGSTGATGHNRLPVLYNEATWQVVRQYGGIQLARSGWAGAQAIPAIWSGDQSSDTNPNAGLGSAIVAAQSAGLSGYPYWGSDIGGYYGEPTPELYVRWAQFAALTPIMQVHGMGRRQPWEFGTAALDAFRTAAELHARLLPYFQYLADEAAATGLPLVRAMALEFPDEDAVHADWVRFQYLLGPDLLVAPMYFQGRDRAVLLPPGPWIPWYGTDRAALAGGRVVRVAPGFDEIPVFLRAGTVLPTRERAADGTELLRLTVVPDPSRPRRLTLRDGTTVRVGAEHGRPRCRVAGSSVPVRVTTPDGRHTDVPAGEAATIDLIAAN